MVDDDDEDDDDDDDINEINNDRYDDITLINGDWSPINLSQINPRYI